VTPEPEPEPRSPIDRLLDLSGRTAIVTGASGGIGASIAAALAGAGPAVVVHYRSDAAGAAAVTDGIAARGRSAVAVQADLTTADGRRPAAKGVAALRLAAANPPGARSGGLIYSAGAAEAIRAPPSRSSWLRTSVPRGRSRLCF